MAEEEEYEVESIVQARVEKKKGKGGPVIWKYLVKWKGYSDGSNTWEPRESFDGGSEHIIDRFWVRANTGNRDINNLTLFKAGEEFYPVGPPRRKPKRKATKMEDSRPPSPEMSEANQTPKAVATGKRRRSPQASPDEEGPPTKRTRGRDVGRSRPDASKNRSSSTVTGSKKHPSMGLKSSPPGGALLNISRQQSGSDVADSEVEVIESYLVEAEPSETKTSENGLDLLDPQTEQNGPSSFQIIQQGQVELDDLFDDMQYSAVNQTSEIVPPQPSTSASVAPPSQIPSHRVRAANPLIKLADDPNFKGMGGAISVKARLLRQSSPAASGSEAQANPKPKTSGSSKGLQSRKSSLLVFQKGGLTTLKGKYSAETVTNNGAVEGGDANADPVGMWGGDDPATLGDIPGLTNGNDSVAQAASIPSGQELLKMAGLSAEAETLPDFEDESPMNTEPVAQSSSTWQSLALATNNLFPEGLSSTGDISVPPMWRRPTIFGPLSIGGYNLPLPSPVVETSPVDARPTFSLNLSSSVSIPITLKDITQSVSGSLPLDAVVAKSPNGPPGKFYRDQFALALLDCLRTGGSAARIAIDSPASEGQNANFERFCARLQLGELFVAMAGVNLLCFCSSENALIGQRLDIPRSLLGLPGNILVSRVDIENYSAYGDAAIQADDSRW